MGRVLVVGLDGATFDIIKPLAADGRLPNLAHIMRTGAWGTLRSTIPPVTPAAWTSVFTGKNPGKHGIFDFQKLNRQTYRFSTVRTDHHQEKTVWQLLGEAGKRSIILDVPFTYPPHPLKGLMLTGYGTPRTPDTVFTYPSDLADRVPKRLRSEIRVALPTKRFDRSQRFIEEWQAIMAGRRKLLRYLIAEEAWDFFMVVFSITDNMAHVFWTYVDPAHPNYYKAEAESYRAAFFNAYEKCDRILGDMMALAGPGTTTLVVSDHGFGSVRPRQYTFKRLLEGGFVKPQRQGSAVLLGDRVMNLALATYNRFPFLREIVKNLRPGQREAVKHTLRRAGALPSAAAIDFGRSQLVPANFGLRVWVNEEGKFAQGLVAPSEKDDLLEKVSDFLCQDVDQATGEPIIAATYRGNELFYGPHAEKGPDLIIEYSNFYQPEADNPPRNPHVEGGHTLDGIFVAHGEHVSAGRTVKGASLIDLAPTILHLLGQEIPSDFDGSVLTDVLHADYLGQNPIELGEAPARWDSQESGAGYTEEEDAELREQLRQLGYI